MKVIYSLKRLFEYTTHRFHEKKKYVNITKREITFLVLRILKAMP